MLTSTKGIITLYGFAGPMTVDVNKMIGESSP